MKRKFVKLYSRSSVAEKSEAALGKTLQKVENDI